MMIRRLLAALPLFPLTLLLGASAPGPDAGLAPSAAAPSDAQTLAAAVHALGTDAGPVGARALVEKVEAAQAAASPDSGTPGASAAAGTATPVPGASAASGPQAPGAREVEPSAPKTASASPSGAGESPSEPASGPDTRPVDARALAEVLAAKDGAALEPGMVPPLPVPSREKAPPFGKLQGLPRAQDLVARAKLVNSKLVVKGGKDAPDQVLTIDPGLQASLTKIMENYQVPYGAAVVLEPSTGRVLAMAEHSQAKPELRGLPIRAVYPAASIFKIVTGSALLEAGVSPDTEACFHGGKRRLSERQLEDTERDGACYSLAMAMGKSANVIFAKMTSKHLSAEALKRMAARLRFNREIPFAQPLDVSLAYIPEDGFALANTGAGFGDVYLSPLHGALLAAVAANEGRWVDPVLVEPEPFMPLPEPEPVLTPTTAHALTKMLEETVTHGTARHIFRERGFQVPNAVGKTGTLADREPFRDYSWFVGFAPKDHPRVAVAALIVNDPKWRIRGSYLGREALRLALERVPAPVEVTAPAGAAGKH
ncbi:penicillin-binding transpeptidase domain-containing protein [Corallococcus silvisoli]|uniref:penicillin-binding transpeptidase domain-containing protein n=1 Tax=Corallococcus silvisoli TaxID=2697031 RepID=UPI0013789030|nr:penicillin-binding transpeptidase domain-containing protein [Corallococcus silvisoli]NBD13513.1 penicillin-binding protein [Corallococcus silvisoli]